MICRCGWVNNDRLYIEYHDKEWGVPVHEEERLFELLILEGVQAGLSWYTVLKKREHYREAFNGFDPAQVAAFDEAKLGELLTDAGLVRNRLKMRAAVANARAFLKVQEECGSFDRFIWQFVGGTTMVNYRQTLQDVPASTPESDAMSKALKKRGFSFVGSTICYAFMQATGMVMDHTVDCFRYQELAEGRANGRIAPAPIVDHSTF